MTSMQNYLLLLFLACMCLVLLLGFYTSSTNLIYWKKAASTGSWTDRLIIIYNRVPKTGSTSFMNIAYNLYADNNFNVLHVNATRFATRLSGDEQARFVRNVTSWTNRMPGIYHGHFSFIDFDNFSTVTTTSDPLRVTPTVLHVNVVREPVARLVSYYYFLRFGDDYRPHVIRGRQSNSPMMFDDCVQKRGRDCSPEKLWLQVPYFCGQHKFCMQPPGNQLSLQRAKQNLLKKYFLVGITEELTLFVHTIEVVLPSIFTGAEQVFNRTDSWKRRTKFKQLPSNASIATFQNHPVYQAEKELYEYAKKLFHHARKRILKGDFIVRNGWLADDADFMQSLNDEDLTPTNSGLTKAQSLFFRTKGTQFFYEKIKPP